MSTPRYLLLGTVLLGACAPRLTSTLASAPPASTIGVPTVAVPPTALEAENTRLEQALAQRIAGGSWSVPVQLAKAGFVRLRVGADASFGRDSAQLLPGALLFYAEVAEVLRQTPSYVLHVVGHGDAATAEDPASDLSSRRAASVLSYLRSRGAPEARLRAEGRAGREPAVAADVAATGANRHIELIFKPIVLGNEPAAWSPPPGPDCDTCF